MQSQRRASYFFLALLFYLAPWGYSQGEFTSPDSQQLARGYGASLNVEPWFAEKCVAEACPLFFFLP